MSLPIQLLGSSLPSTEKLIWVVVMLIIPVIGSLLYYFMKRQPRHGGTVTGGRLTHA